MYFSCLSIINMHQISANKYIEFVSTYLNILIFFTGEKHSKQKNIDTIIHKYSFEGYLAMSEC